jgi:hypothetical protein
MSVTLLRCSKCGDYSIGAKVNLVVSARLDAKRGEFQVRGDIYPEAGIPLEDFVEGYCDECDSPTELVTLDECPHFWGAQCSNRPTRICMFCDERQYGRAVFDE